MKHIYLIMLTAASATFAGAQASTTPVAAPAPPATTQAVPAAATKPTIPASGAARPAWEDAPLKLADIHCGKLKSCVLKLPPGIPPADGKLVSAFSLRYQDLKIGDGAFAEPSKTYTIHYTAWLATDGNQFDSTYEHRGTIMDKDGKPLKDADGKEKLGPAQPFSFTQGTQGFDRVLTGLDLGFDGMRVGGKRRLIIPYQLGFGTVDRPSPDAGRQGIPPKSDLIFDVELLEVKEPVRKGESPGSRSPRPPAHPAAGAPAAAPGPAASPAPASSNAPAQQPTK